MDATETLTGQASSEPQPLVRFDGLAHVPLEDGLTLLYREGDDTVTIVGMVGVLQPGSVLVLA